MTQDFYFSEMNEQHLYDGLEEEACIGEELHIPGPAGPIEALTSCPDCYDGTRPVAVICHPHPLYGGSMTNKVVHALSDTFNEMGMLSALFNFRGVGHSAGRFDNGVGETQDLLAVVDWFRNKHPEAPLWLAGFSFGAYVAARGHVDARAERLLLVAPPVTMFDFGTVPSIDVPCMVIQGGQDDIIAPEKVSEWVHGQRHMPEYRWMANADHFFHGRMNRLKEVVFKSWSEAVAA